MSSKFFRYSLTLSHIVVGRRLLFLSLLRVSASLTSETLCRVPCPFCLFHFSPKRRQPGARENLCSMNHSEVLPLVAPLSPARRFAGG